MSCQTVVDITLAHPFTDDAVIDLVSFAAQTDWQSILVSVPQLTNDLSRTEQHQWSTIDSGYDRTPHTFVSLTHVAAIVDWFHLHLFCVSRATNKLYLQQKKLMRREKKKSMHQRRESNPGHLLERQGS